MAVKVASLAEHEVRPERASHGFGRFWDDAFDALKTQKPGGHVWVNELVDDAITDAKEVSKTLSAARQSFLTYLARKDKAAPLANGDSYLDHVVVTAGKDKKTGEPGLSIRAR